MPLVVRWRNALRLPVEVPDFRPDRTQGMSLDALRQRACAVGNGDAPLGELFTIEGEADGELVLEGDFRNVARIGEGMTTGHLAIRGDAGPHLGAGMSGGTIDVHGSVGPWAGAEMRGGLLRIRGDAGDWLGAAYPGSRLGMREGVILVEGTAGAEVGLAMRRGLIAVRGGVGDAPAHAMVAGSVFVFGSVGVGAGLGMKRGTLALFDATLDPADAVPATFAPSGHDRPPFLSIYLRHLRGLAFPMPTAEPPATLHRYTGDLAVGGQGEIWLAGTG
jgi:formylmethanofuran dehydrogenase subunit C